MLVIVYQRAYDVFDITVVQIEHFLSSPRSTTSIGKMDVCYVRYFTTVIYRLEATHLLEEGQSSFSVSSKLGVYCGDVDVVSLKLPEFGFRGVSSAPC